jgi:enamine deaminase RidA (YjgF/YER057c/UK114 family)
VSTREIAVADWPRPRGYANGRIGRGDVLHVAGQIGWDAQAQLVPGGLLEQFAQALDNVVAVVRAAGGTYDDIASMTIFVTDIAAYRDAVKDLALIWKPRLGKHYPAMALIGVAALVEPGALIEIQATAYVGDAP